MSWFVIAEPRKRERCYLCRLELGPYQDERGYARLHIDHVVPLAQGGTWDEDNLRWVHKRCNLQKGPRTLDQIAHLFPDLAL